jgi:anti-sigma factor RsiW
MNHTPPPLQPVTDDELHALVDGQLTPQAEAQLRARIDQNATAAATLHAWQTQRDALRGLHADLLGASVPTPMGRAASLAQRQQDRTAHWWRWGGMAACVVLAFSLGWAGHRNFGERDTHASADASAGPNGSTALSFAQQAVLAHVVYLPEVRHPVEVPAAQQDHLVQWLSKRLERPLKVPNLAAQGYELVGGRLLPGESGARAQFMFQNAAGERATLYMGALPANAAGATTNQETAFRFAEDGAASTFYWVDQGFGYALAGRLPRATLQALATAVYRQL